MEAKQYIRIAENAAIDSTSLPGNALSLKAFKAWIAAAEKTPAISLKEAKSKWSDKRKQLQKSGR